MRPAGSLSALLRGVGFAEVSVADGAHRGVHNPNLPMNVMLQVHGREGEVRLLCLCSCKL